MAPAKTILGAHCEEERTFSRSDAWTRDVRAVHDVDFLGMLIPSDSIFQVPRQDPEAALPWQKL